ncbi:hypothetical protein HID58_087702 [Brassica napus]|uniref:Protochlorophyllide reductase n=1 Tax=Brassica napus TaxID=3708 RepID=A0ABQ7XU48_BRANA|nr:hypothetical protein HID58_087702 [Brassica napus]
MALQAASLVSSVRKDGKSNASSSLKESSLFGASLSDQIKADLVSFSLRCKREQRLRTTGAKIRAQTIVTSTPSVTRSTFDRKKTLRKGNVVVTGASSGLRDFLKAERAAKSAGMPKDSYTVMHFGLSIVGQREAVREPRCLSMCWSATPLFISQWLINLLSLLKGNTNTLAGNVLPKANLGDLRGLASGLNGRNNSAMIDGGDFNGAKAYKDSKVCNMLTMQEFHRRFREETGITFASLYPGCIATTGLFREHITLFRSLFPLFQKYITKGYVPEAEAGKRLAQVVGDPNLTKSGVYWSWNKTSASFENQLSQEASDVEKARRVWEVSEKLVGLA